jgi:hypothetical protein
MYFPSFRSKQTGRGAGRGGFGKTFSGIPAGGDLTAKTNIGY